MPTFDLLNLESLVPKMPELIELDKPFTKEQIDAVVKDLPSDKAPGPDGFNTDFIKHCWDIIAPDFYKLIEDFYNGKLNL